MLSELEARLADVLGARLPAPFAGRVRVRPQTPPGSGPAVQVAVTSASPLADDFRSTRREQLPGGPDLRRVVRLRCELAIEVSPGGGEGRLQELAGVDALLFLLDDAELRDGSALVAPGDQGFRLDELVFAATTPPTVDVVARGWFWPVGEAGEAGPAIDEARIRQALLPVRLEPPPGRLLAGGPATELTLVFGTAGVALAGDQPPASHPFGSVSVAVVGPGGQPGAGDLTGGAAGPDGRRVVDVADGRARVSYTPPAAPSAEAVVITTYAEDAGGDVHVGPELARFPLRVVAAP